MLSKSIKVSWLFEAIAWIATGLALLLILLPIIQNVPDFPFLYENIWAVILFITLMRYIFLLRATPFRRFAPVKIIFIFVAIPLIIFLLDGLSEFQFYLDEKGTYEMVSHLNINKQIPLSNYIRSEMIFFSVGAIIGAALLPIRMIISLWRVRNRNRI